MPKQRTVVWTMLLFAMMISSAYAVGFEVAVGGWQQDPGGDAAYKPLTDAGILDVDNDLKYDTKTQVMARAKIEMPLFLPNIYLMAAPAQFDGIGRKDVNFQFGDSTIIAGTDFYSKLTYNQYDVGLYYGLPFLRTATLNKFNIDLGLDARILDLEALLSQDTIYEKHRRTVAIPLVYAAAQLTPVDWLAIEAEGMGISINGNNLYTAIGRVRLKVFGPAFIAAGYRYDKVDVDEDDIKVNLTIQGPFAEIGLKF